MRVLISEDYPVPHGLLETMLGMRGYAVHSKAEFTHSVCPECRAKLVAERR